MNEENKRHNPGAGAIHPEPVSAERNTVPNNNKQIHRKRLIQEIEEKRRLINLTKAMSGAPASEGGINQEKANKTVQLLKEDISSLAKELTELESDPKNFETNNDPEPLILEYPPLLGETKNQSTGKLKQESQTGKDKKQELPEMNLPLSIKEKHREEKVDTPEVHSAYKPISGIETEPINKHTDSSHSKFSNKNNLIVIILLLLIIGIVVTGLQYFNSYRQTRIPQSPDNIVEKAANPTLAFTNTSNTTGLVARSKNEVSSFITNIVKEIAGWWGGNNPKEEFSSISRDIKNEPVTDADKIIGKWVMYEPGDAQNRYENSYTFNRDNTGEKITTLDGKSSFKYQVSGDNIVLLDIKPCRGFDIIPQDTSINPCEKRVKRYEFHDDNTLIIDNTMFERK